jgi:hypothetical protein
LHGVEDQGARMRALVPKTRERICVWSVWGGPRLVLCVGFRGRRNLLWKCGGFSGQGCMMAMWLAEGSLGRELVGGRVWILRRSGEY